MWPRDTRDRDMERQASSVTQSRRIKMPQNKQQPNIQVFCAIAMIWHCIKVVFRCRLPSYPRQTANAALSLRTYNKPILTFAVDFADWPIAVGSTHTGYIGQRLVAFDPVSMVTVKVYYIQVVTWRGGQVAMARVQLWTHDHYAQQSLVR